MDKDFKERFKIVFKKLLNNKEFKGVYDNILKLYGVRN
jgi:hypothetical protein